MRRHGARGGFKTPADVSMDSKLRAKQRSEPGVSYLVLTRAAGINPSLTESRGYGPLGGESVSDNQQCTLRNPAVREVAS